MSNQQYEFDLFVSHAGEDKASVVQPLEEALKAAGIKVYYDKDELQAGLSLRKQLERAMIVSKQALMIVSPAYLGIDEYENKNIYWTEGELEGFFVLEETRRQGDLILPVWHNIYKAKIADFSPILASKFAFNTHKDGNLDIDNLVKDILHLIAPEKAKQYEEKETSEKKAWRSKLNAISNDISKGNTQTIKKLGELADRVFGNRRQECIDILCEFIRGDRQVDDIVAMQKAILTEIQEHCTIGHAKETSWSSMHFDFTKALFREIKLDNIELFGNGMMDFHESVFDGNYFNFFKLYVHCDTENCGIRFGGTIFRKGVTFFDEANFSRGSVDFSGAVFEGEGGRIQLRNTKIEPGVCLRNKTEFLKTSPPDLVTQVYNDGISL